MKSLPLISAALTASILLSGCGQLIPNKSTLPTFSPAEPTQAVTEPEPIIVQPTEAPSTAALDAYRFVLEQLCYEHVWPDHQDAGFDGRSIEENKFCITDLDGDGKDELVIQYTTTSMAGNVFRVYGYDEEASLLYPELSAFPAVTIYDGLIKADASHNHSTSMAFWPYTLYRYDAESDTYQEVYYVSGWEKQFAQEDYEGHPFPEDKAEDGMVYRLEQNGAAIILSPSEFQKWEQEQIPTAEPRALSWLALSQEHIQPIGTGSIQDWRRGQTASTEISWFYQPKQVFLIPEADGVALYCDAPVKQLLTKAMFPKPLAGAENAEITYILTDQTNNGTGDLDVTFRLPDGSDAHMLWLWNDSTMAYEYNPEFSNYPGEPTGKG